MRGGGDIPSCPYQKGRPPCRKHGGVCSLQRYGKGVDDRIGAPEGDPAIVCPARLEEGRMLVGWLAEIVGFRPEEVAVAREVPFMRGTGTNKPAGKIDLVVAKADGDELKWYGLEMQAVYFSGKAMQSEFVRLRGDSHPKPPFPDSVRRPDWRSSSAKRLMPQLQIKVPTLRRWASKIAVAMDRPFFRSLGGPSPNFSRDLDDGAVIWLVPELVPGARGGYRLSRGHWEVLTLEDTSKKLLAAETIRRSTFEQDLRKRFEPLY